MPRYKNREASLIMQAQEGVKVYRIARGWKIFMVISTSLILALFVWVLSVLLSIKSDAGWIFIPVALAIAAVIVLGLIETFRSCLVIENDRVTSTGLFSTRELTCDGIKGYRVNDQYIFVEPMDSEAKHIKISRYTKDFKEILNWLADNFTDIDQQKRDADMKEILADKGYGLNRYTRSENLKRAAVFSRVLNWAACISLIWIIFYPRPFEPAMLSALLIPLIAAASIVLSHGLIRPDDVRNSSHPNISAALTCPAIALLARSLMEYEIFSFSKVWPLAIPVSLVLIVLFMVITGKFRSKKLSEFVSALFIFIFIFLYGIGSVIFLNCHYDRSKPEIFSSSVLDKNTARSRHHTSYRLKLAPWGKRKSAERTEVSKSMYQRTAVGSQVRIFLKRGKFNIPWFFVASP